MVNNSLIKAAWVAKLKANTAVTALVSANEIREVEWKGEDFVFPNIRVALGKLTPTTKSETCRVFSSVVSILIFTEEKSSKTADDIAGVVAEQFWGKSFSYGGVRFSGIVLDDIEPATTPEKDQNAWRSVVNLTALVQNG